MSFKWDSRKVKRNLQTLPPRIDVRLNAIFSFQAQRGEAYMKLHAPWTDRTSAARNGLYTRFSRPSKHRREILFSHSVAYGIWLEVANAGDYQIIMPSVRVIGRDTMAQLNGLFGDLK